MIADFKCIHSVRSISKVLCRYKSSTRTSPDIQSMIRVNLAGETGANQIYAGQMAILGDSRFGPKIKEMWEQEKHHMHKFEELVNTHRVRPSLLTPVWHIAGFALGAGTALLGPKAAMACTVAVESVIVEHYNEQLRQLMNDDKKNEELLNTIQKFRDEEQEHHDIGIEHEAEKALLYDYLSGVIKAGSKFAIAVAKVI